MKKLFLIVTLLALNMCVQAQYIDRIVRPCSAGATTLASVIVNPNNSNNVIVTSCVGGQLIVNGSAVVPNGLPDPGSNGIVVRTAANTTVARTITGSGGVTVGNGNGVAAAPDVSISNIVVAGSCTACSLTYNAKGQVTTAASGSSGANTALSNLVAVAINAALLPGVDNSIGLGSSDFRWSGIKLGSAGALQFDDLNGTGNVNSVAYLNGTGPRFIDGATTRQMLFNVQAFTVNRTFTWPNQSGVVCTTGSVCAGYQPAGSYPTNSAGANVIPKSNGANLIASRISDAGAGSAVNVNSGADSTVIGDTGAIGNGTTLTVDDVAQLVTINQGLSIGGGIQAASSISTGDSIYTTAVGLGTLGASPKPWEAMYLGDSAAASTFLASNATAHRNVLFPDAAGTIALVITATSGSIGGGALLAGACASGTTSVTSSTTAMTVSLSPNTYPGDAVFWKGYVSSNGTVTVKVCAAIAATPAASTYNIRVIQ